MLMKLAISTLISISFIISFSQSLNIQPTNPNINYIGRFNFTNPNNTLFDWPGCQIQLTFSNSSFITILLVDGKNNYDVFIDNQEQPTLVTNTSTTYNYTGLSLGKHTFILYKRTEGVFGIAQFQGFTLQDGANTYPTPRWNRKIEYVGASLVCGFGVESPSPNCTLAQYRKYEDNYQAFSAVSGRSLCSEYHITAFSGKGMVHNNGDPEQVSAYPIPKYFMQTMVNDPEQNWNFSSWIPDAVVILAGNNDFSTQPWPTQAQYEGNFTYMPPGPPTEPTEGFGYLNFIQLVHHYYPNAEIFASSEGSASPGPMDQYVRDVVQQARNDGASYVHLLELSPNISFTGCLNHPNVQGAAIWGENASSYIQATMGWRNCSNPGLIPVDDESGNMENEVVQMESEQFYYAIFG